MLSFNVTSPHQPKLMPEFYFFRLRAEYPSNDQTRVIRCHGNFGLLFEARFPVGESYLANYNEDLQRNI